MPLPRVYDATLNRAVLKKTRGCYLEAMAGLEPAPAGQRLRLAKEGQGQGQGGLVSIGLFRREAELSHALPAAHP